MKMVENGRFQPRKFTGRIHPDAPSCIVYDSEHHPVVSNGGANWRPIAQALFFLSPPCSMAGSYALIAVCVSVDQKSREKSCAW